MSADENRVLVVDDSPVYRHLISIRCSRLRDECLNANWFTSLSDARRKIETWRQDYNEQRPHSSLHYLPPAEFARTAVAGQWK
jgi:putative transposase